jgi:hypothetical protein
MASRELRMRNLSGLDSVPWLTFAMRARYPSLVHPRTRTVSETGTEHMRRHLLALGIAAALSVAACGDDDPTGPALEVNLGETTLVVLVNPVINTANGVSLPSPGSARSGVSVSWAGDPPVMTDGAGVAVLGGIASGARALSVSGSGSTGSVTASIADKDLHEIALALTSGGAAVMTNLRYAFGGEVVEILPDTPAAQVNAQLARSNVIVLLRGGTYAGDLVFSGSDVTLFGAGVRGGEVTLQGNVSVGGSSNRIRGARIAGNLSVTGSNAGISFSRVSGSFSLVGSSAVLLNNAFCGPVTVTGSNPTMLTNAGLAPISAPSAC